MKAVLFLMLLVLMGLFTYASLTTEEKPQQPAANATFHAQPEPTQTAYGEVSVTVLPHAK